MKFDLNEIIKKYNFPEDFIPLFKKIYEAFIDFLGTDKEPVIYKAFLNTKFVFNKSVCDALIEENMLEVNDIVTLGDLKRASGVYESTPIISYSNGKYQIDNIKRIVVASKFDMQKSWTIGTFIHELAHLVKAYYQEFEIEGDILITRSGFIEERFKLEVEDGVVKRKLISKTGTGLEEGLNCCLEEDIMKKYFDSNYKHSGYGSVRGTTRAIQDYFGLQQIFLNAQFYKDFREIEELIGKDLFLQLKELEDRFYLLDLECFANLFNREKSNQLFEEINEVMKRDLREYVKSLKERGLSCQK